MTTRKLLTGLLGLLLAFNLWAGETLPSAYAVASAHPLATAAGMDTLKAGGNAFDAAVAVTAALAVVEPAGSGLGGGGFWLLRHVDGSHVMIDGRETAPLAATEAMYLDSDGKVRPRASLDGPLAAAIPGVPAGMVHIARKYGRLPLKKSLAPAIRYAEQGFEVGQRYRRLVELRHQALLVSPDAADVFLQDGSVPEKGYRILQPDLAATLKAIASQGRDGFYSGRLARQLVQGVRDAGGIWTQKDLTQYRVRERKPLSGTYHGWRITSAPLPSSGGVVLLQMLNILEGFRLDSMPKWRQHHIVIEAMRRAYRDRAEYLGDADFVAVDVRQLIDKQYAAGKRREIDPGKATPSKVLKGISTRSKGTDTTHFSVMDRQGNAVAATLSINYPFGCGFVPPGTGVVLNNEMDDFVIKPGVPNVYGLVGNRANAIAPGKRPLSSMTPTFLENDTQLVALGTPGGSRIISMVLLASLEAMHGRGGLKDWLALPRFHHQYLPDRVIYEAGAFTTTEEAKLQRMGHSLKKRQSTYGERAARYGDMQAVRWHKRMNRVEAAADPRREGQGSVQR